MLTKDELPACPVATMVVLIGNKWKLLIIRNLLASSSRFGELRNGIPGISQKVLTDNLRSLEADGLVVRTVYPEVPPRVEYSLSEIGNTLRPLFKSMEEWGDTYKSYIASTSDIN
jgi:DNA-binding HxlR family transcriptional regulator